MKPWGFPGGTSRKELVCQCRRHKKCRFDPWVKKIPWRRAWQPTPVFTSREFHEQRSLVGCSPYGHKEVDTTEATWHAHTHTYHSYSEKNPPEICFQTPAWGQICTFQVITYESLYFLYCVYICAGSLTTISSHPITYPISRASRFRLLFGSAPLPF